MQLYLFIRAVENKFRNIDPITKGMALIFLKEGHWKANILPLGAKPAMKMEGSNLLYEQLTSFGILVTQLCNMRESREAESYVAGKIRSCNFL